jgi:hypothetical protein
MQLDPTPVDFLEDVWVQDTRRLYVAGPEGPHRLFSAGEFTPLPLTGSVAGLLRPEFGLQQDWYVIATSDPNALVVLDLASLQIVDAVPLDAPPTGLCTAWEDGWVGVALADADALLHAYAWELDTLTLVGSRELPEVLDLVDNPAASWAWDPDLGQAYLGLASTSHTAWLLEPPLLDGVSTPWPFVEEVVSWEIDMFTDNGDERVLAFSQNPAAATLYSHFADAEPFLARPLGGHTAREYIVGIYPVGEQWGAYLLSEDAHIALFGLSGGEAFHFYEPEAWIAAPEGTADFAYAGVSGLYYASTIHGFGLLPTAP